MNTARIVSLAAFGLLQLTGSAFAHAHLKSAAPAINGTVAAAPKELDLTFTEDVNLTFMGVSVIGPDRKAVTTGAGSLANGGTTLVVPVSATLPGAYKVEWHALAVDGHKTNGSYTFTVAP